jgi:RNA methyltransferase, TrmH family
MISSAHNPRLKLARSLASRARARREAAAFLAEGVRLVEEALASGWPFEFVLHTHELSERGQGLIRAIAQRGIPVDEVDRDLLASLSETETSQGILAILKESTRPFPDKPDFVLILDSVRDPGNLGTLLRTADAFGVQAVLIPPETADVYAPKVVRAGMGAHFRLPIQSMDWDAIRRLTTSWGMPVYLADMQGKSCWEIDLRPPLALIIGGEAEGASGAARRLAPQAVSIPMRGKAESLNAAVAGSILMFEVLRQSRGRASLGGAG